MRDTSELAKARATDTRAYCCEAPSLLLLLCSIPDTGAVVRAPAASD